MDLQTATNYSNGIPREWWVRATISNFINCECYVQFGEDYGSNVLNVIRFAYEHPDEPIEPLIEHLRKNGFNILAIEENELNTYPDYNYSLWFDIVFFAYSMEN